MPANTAPIYIKAPKIGAAAWLNADGNNTAFDGTGTFKTLFTAGAEGSYVDRIIARPVGTNSGAIDARVFLHDGSSYWYLTDLSLQVNTISTTAGNAVAQCPIGIGLPTGWSVRVALAATPTVGWHFTVLGGDY